MPWQKGKTVVTNQDTNISQNTSVYNNNKKKKKKWKFVFWNEWIADYLMKQVKIELNIILIIIFSILLYCGPIYPTPPLGQDMTQGQFFKQS